MHVAKEKSARGAKKTSRQAHNGTIRSLRELKAFGLWADRTDATDPVQFTKAVRTRMERGDDAK